MKGFLTITATTFLSLASAPLLAEDVKLVAPVLQWSFYIFLIFALAVAVGIFFLRKKQEITDEPLANLIEGADSEIHYVSPYTSVVECVQRMNRHKIGAMLVMEDDKLVGIFTERDCLTRVVGAWMDPKTTQVGQVMTKDPYCVSPATSLEEAMNIISTQRFRHLPVVEDGKVLGIVSSGDLTHRLVAERPTEVRELVDTAGRRRASL
jgi:CBS domain-containing protein